MTTCLIDTQVRGLRSLSEGLRLAERLALSFDGLPEDASKNELLALMESIPAKAVKVNKPAWKYLHHLVKSQNKEAFLPRSKFKNSETVSELDLISTYSDAYIAVRLGVTARSLCGYRKTLAEAGLIAFRESSSRARYCVKQADKVIEAYGIDLRPLLSRFAELRSLRTKTRIFEKELLSQKARAARAKNRIRVLLPFISDDVLLDEGNKAVRLLNRVKDKNDLELAIAVADQSEALIVKLETCVDKGFSGIFQTKKPSGRPEKKSGHIPPTSPNHPSIEVQVSCQDSTTTVVEAPALPEAISTNTDVDGTTVVFSEVNHSDEAADGTLLWEFTSNQARKPAVWHPTKRDLIHTPSLKLAIEGLAKVMLPTKGYKFERLAMYENDHDLFLGYGVFSAMRLGFSPIEAQASARIYGLPFALAALISEFRPSISHPQAHLRAILAKLMAGDEPVNLTQSWTATIREIQGLSHRSPSYRSRCIS